MLLEAVYSVTDPPIKALRRVIPPLRLGSFALDLSFLIVMIGAYVLLTSTTGSSLRLMPRCHGVTLTMSTQTAGAIVRPTVYCDNEWVRSCR